jgi:hypothetical protein
MSIGCSTKQPISKSSLSSLKNQKITQTQRQIPIFSALTADKVMFGVIAGIGAFSPNNYRDGIINNNKIDDPANSIATSLVSTLSNAYGMSVATHRISIFKS